MTDSVLVTAASNGIGRAIATRLTQDGFSVVNLDRERPRSPLPRETYLEVDLSDPKATAQALREVVSRHAPTRLVNNAGTVRPGALEDVTLEDLQVVVALNLHCSIQCAQALLPAMKAARFGRIVNIASRAALGKELRTVYSATKAGLLGMTRTWALELAAQGITVNAIGPGPIATELFHRVNPADSPRTKAIIEGVPVKRLGTPDDIAHAAAYFLDARAGFVTGQVLYVCGGMTVGLS
ncbi:MAG TPA: SDR family oxidoreductase [Burkholderiaceae bacterium]|jgi:3-oxoacyl-[acyl-carrier protein] reductase|nr:SDR family oxidoreductase [Burkholderiaceae bacterium]